VKLFRTLSTTRLILLCCGVAIVAAGGAFAVAARGGGGATPAPKPLANAIHDALAATEPAGVTARIAFTNKLFPSGALTGQAGPALMSSATGRLWADATGGRLELQSDAGDTQIVWSETKVTVYDATSNTAYVADLPAKSGSGTSSGIPTLDRITTFLTDLARHWTVSGAQPANLAGHEAYSVTISPSHDGGLLGSAQLAWDAIHGVPLRIAVYAQGSSSPVLALQATDISFGAVPASDIAVAPPAGAKIVDLSSQAGSSSPGGKEGAPVTGLAAVQAAAPFAVVAPDTLVGLPRRDVRLVGPADGRSAVVIYGQGLGAIVVVERKHDAQSAGGGSEMLTALPSISLDGVTAHELSTQLGTVLGWDSAGVTYLLAGSIPPSAAEAAARALR
jgi:hypothetical protein